MNTTVSLDSTFKVSISGAVSVTNPTNDGNSTLVRVGTQFEDFLAWYTGGELNALSERDEELLLSAFEGMFYSARDTAAEDYFSLNIELLD